METIHDNIAQKKTKAPRKKKVIEDDLLKKEIDRDPIKYTSKGTVRMSWVRSEAKSKQIEMDLLVEERAKVLSSDSLLKESIKQKKLDDKEAIKQKKIELKQREKNEIKQKKLDEKNALKMNKAEEKETKMEEKIKSDMRGKSEKCRAHQKNLHNAIKDKFIKKNIERERKYPDEEEVITTTVTKRTRSRTPDPIYRSRVVDVIPEEKLDTMRDLQRNIFKGIL